METEQQEMQFLGLIGIYVEAYKLIFRCRKIFSQITLALILPLSFIFLAEEKVSEILSWRLMLSEVSLENTEPGTPKYNQLADLVSSQWVTYVLIKAVYLAFILIFSLLSTSAVVYTVASVYTSREVSFKRVMSIVPKVWKRLMVTFLFTLFAFCAYSMYLPLAGYLLSKSGTESYAVGLAIVLIILISYGIGFVYMTIIWLLASVVSVLEDSCGVKALIKSMNLIKGKMLVTAVIFFKLNISFVIVNMLCSRYVFSPWREDAQILKRIGYGVLYSLLLFKLILFALVVQTVIYFVCKSYHHENIDKSALSDHLEVYLGDYVPLMAKDVQLNEYHV